MRQHLRLWRSNLSNLSHAARRKLPLRSLTDSVEGVTQLAADLTNLERSGLTVSNTVLQKNRQSIVHRFEVRASCPSKGELVLDLVAKRTRKATEYRLYRHCQRAQSRSELQALPKVHFTKRYWLANPDDYRFFFVIERLGACGLPDYSETTAYQLAERMSAISTLRADEMPWVDKAESQLKPELLEQFISAAHDGGYVESLETASTLESMRRDWHSLSTLGSNEMSLVPCHNDLHVKNLGMRCASHRNELVFFDWEKFGLNYLGSDLHHFISKGISEPEFKPFSDALQKRYREIASDVHRVEKRTVDIAALSYSLFRCITRSVMHKDNKKRRLQVNHVTTLYHRLREVLCIPLLYLCESFPLPV